MNVAWALAQAGGSGGGTGPRWVWPEQSTLPLKPLLWAATVLVGVLLLAWFGRLARRWWHRLEPVRVFWALGGRLGLTHADRWWLWRVGRRAKLASPITLLICPSTLRVHAEAQGGGRSLSVHDTRRLNEVIERLHGPGSASVNQASV